VEGSFEHGDEPSGSIKCWEVILSGCKIGSFSSRAQLRKLFDAICSTVHNFPNSTTIKCSRLWMKSHLSRFFHHWGPSEKADSLIVSNILPDFLSNLNNCHSRRLPRTLTINNKSSPFLNLSTHP
jgi:hypothetical protein